LNFSDRTPKRLCHAFATEARHHAIRQNHMDNGNMEVAGEVQRVTSSCDNALCVLRFCGHRRHFHIQMAAVHVNRYDRRLSRVEYEQLLELGHQLGAVGDFDGRHRVSPRANRTSLCGTFVSVNFALSTMPGIFAGSPERYAVVSCCAMSRGTLHRRSGELNVAKFPEKARPVSAVLCMYGKSSA
jgi:hypothetical protein